MKFCPRCKTEKLLSEFGFRPNGNTKAYCKSCYAKYHKQDYWAKRDQYLSRKRKNLPKLRKRKRELILAAKAGKPCMDCKQNFPPHCMDFDHLENKVFNLADSSRHIHSDKKILEEIAKCELVCSNCHRIRTWNRVNRSVA